MPESSFGSDLRCPLCNASGIAVVTNRLRFGKSGDVCQCAACGLIFLDQASFDLPADFYEGAYHQTYLTHVEPDALDPAAYYAKMKQATVIWAARFRSMLKGDECVLDVGCSTGHFIDLVKGNAAHCYGHELNIKEVDFCRNVLKLDVDRVPLAERFAKGSFDYISLIFVLEHIANPVEFLNELREYLKPGGSLVIVVPNAMDPLLALYEIPEFGEFYYCVEHLYYYTPSTIHRLFDLTGLGGTVETVQEYPLANHLNWAYRKKPSATLAARQGIPDLPLSAEASEPSWNQLWHDIDGLYRAFLKRHGFGDRLWCIVSKKG